MISSDTISTASRVLDCCNGYYVHMKPVVGSDNVSAPCN